MTNRNNVIFHLMLAGMIAGIVAVVIDKHSFYDHMKMQYIRELTKEPDVPAALEAQPLPGDEPEVFKEDDTPGPVNK